MSEGDDALIRRTTHDNVNSGYNMCMNARSPAEERQYALMDSGCSTHIVGNANMLDDNCYRSKVDLRGISKNPIPIMGTGSMMLCLESTQPGEYVKIHLDRVFIVKGCPGLLLSTSQLADNGIITRLPHRDVCEMRTCANLASFTRCGNIYILPMHQDKLNQAELYVPLICDGRNVNAWTSMMQVSRPPEHSRGWICWTLSHTPITE